MTSESELSPSESRADDTPTSVALALCERCEWQAAYDLLRAADAQGQLDPRGLELQAECARWVGDADRVVTCLERAHHALVGDAAGAARTALALCYTHMDACEAALAASWWRRADELIAELPEGPEHGLHAWFAGRACGDEGDLDGHEQHARRALGIAQRFGDRNVEALALIDLGHVATARGRSSEALRLLDRATALALGGEIGVLETGLVYCNAIIACRSRGEWDRAQEWADSANRWVSRVRVSYFPGLCRVHRAEVLRIRGELLAAESEAVEAVRLLHAAIPRWLALGYIELGEIRRRRGNLAGASQAYRLALGAGWDPQPGYALLVLAQGDAAGAHRMLERFCKSRIPTLLCEDRAGLLRARVSVALAAGEMETASAVLEELAALAEGDSLPWDRAAHAQAEGELARARGQRSVAIERLHAARTLWAELDAPYELATSCRLLGAALADDGDALGATLEFEAALGVFGRLGATRERETCEALLGGLGDGPVPLRPPASTEASLRCEGDTWSIEFEQASVRVKDGKGPRYLARLLAEPGREILAFELASGRGAPSPSGDAGDTLDDEARAAYRARLTELQSDLEEANRHNDWGRSERCREEMEALTAQLAAAFGLGGRARRQGDPHERARQSVTKAIRATLRKLADADEALGRYLSNTIRTGITCRFDPDPGRPIHWHVEG